MNAPDPIERLRRRIVLGPDGTPVSPVKDREAWKAVRETRIGSSDAPALLGVDPWKGAWDVFDRIVLGDWQDASGPDIRRGNRQEANARDRFTEVYELDVLELPMIRHPEDKRIVTDLDGLIPRPEEWPTPVVESELWEVVRGLSGPGWLELKVPRTGTYFQYKAEGLPRNYIVQGQHHAAVAGLEWGVFAFYNPEYDDVIGFPVLTDPEWAAGLIGSERRWLEEHVGQRVRPQRPIPEPARWPAKIRGEADERFDDDFLMWAQVVVQQWWELQDAKDQYSDAEQKLLSLLEDDETYVHGGGVTVKRRSTAIQTRTDQKAVRAQLKMLQQEGDTDALLEFDPDDEEFKYQTTPSEKVEVAVHAPNPAEVMV